MDDKDAVAKALHEERQAQLHAQQLGELREARERLDSHALLIVALLALMLLLDLVQERRLAKVQARLAVLENKPEEVT